MDRLLTVKRGGDEELRFRLDVTVPTLVLDVEKIRTVNKYHQRNSIVGSAILELELRFDNKVHKCMPHPPTNLFKTCRVLYSV
jgi:hypothetical protein